MVKGKKEEKERILHRIVRESGEMDGKNSQ